MFGLLTQSDKRDILRRIDSVAYLQQLTLEIGRTPTEGELYWLQKGWTPGNLL